MKTLPTKAISARLFGIYTDADSRVYFVNHMFDEDQLRDCLDLHPGLQTCVVAAIKTRLQQIQSVSARVN